MLKRRGKNYQQIYRNPLPISLSINSNVQLPLVTYNPLSWLSLALQLVLSYSRSSPTDSPVPVNVSRETSSECVFTVSDESGMLSLWQQGFFGKGTLSRSEPSWKGRVEQRLGLASSTNTIACEEVTSNRRDERKIFKTLRSEVQKLEELARLRSLSNTEQDDYKKAVANLDAMKMKREASNTASSDSKSPPSLNKVDKLSKENIESLNDNALATKEYKSSKDGCLLRKEDHELIDKDTNTLKANIESLQLQKTEVFFLQFALGAVQTIEGQAELLIQDLFHICLGSSKSPDNKFLLDYVVYHHYRSLGWCVRSGIKFGCDMLLYKRGPPMLHAEYSVLVIPDGKCGWTDWQDFMAIARVIGGVRKTLVLVFVTCPKQSEFDKILLAKINKQSLEGLFKLYRVTEVVYKRWSPSRTRD